eukprot:759451-Hanusia_phi.AAC.12
MKDRRSSTDGADDATRAHLLLQELEDALVVLESPHGRDGWGAARHDDGVIGGKAERRVEVDIRHD